MTKNKWIVRLIVLITIILSGLILYIKANAGSNNIAQIETKGILSTLLNASQEENEYWLNEKGFEIDQDHLQGNGFMIPNINGRVIYCTEQSVTPAWKANMYRGSNAAYSYYNSNGTKLVSDIFNPANGNFISKELSDDEVRKIEKVSEFGLPYTIRTKGYYDCNKEHTAVSPDEAYVITANPCNEWTPRKQIVIWWLRKTGATNWSALLESLTEAQRTYAKNNRIEIEKLYYEAKAYAKYDRRVKKALASGGKYATNLTDNDNLTSEYYTDNSEEYIKVGPYTVNYVNGKYLDEEIIFGGIGGKQNGETVGLYIQNGNQKIKVEKIITDDKLSNTKYFQPREEDNPDEVSGYYVENTTSKMSPSSGKQFYVLIRKTQLEEDAKLYAHFTWMEATGTECIKQGISYQISEDSLLRVTGKPTKLKLNANNKIKFESNHTQQLTEYYGERKLREETLDLGTVTPPAEDGSYRINIRKIYEHPEQGTIGLAGATFKVTVNGTELPEITTNSDGIILSNSQIVNNEVPDVYEIEEISVPEGYIMQPLKIKFNVLKGYNPITHTWEATGIEEINSSSYATVNLSGNTVNAIIQNIKPTDIPIDQISTYDVEGLKINEVGEPLGGATFKLTYYRNGEGDGQSSTVTSSGKNGMLNFTQLLSLNGEGEDRFILEEVQAPEGYQTIDNIEFKVKKEKLMTLNGNDCYGITEIIYVNVPEGVSIELLHIDNKVKIKIVIPNQRDIQLTSIGGNVWEDAKTGKASLGDGINNTSNRVDRNLANIKVTLYEEGGKLATLTPTEDVTNIYNKINPTLTDSKGKYKFEGVDASKKYYVVFEYDGQVYMPTEYLAKGINGDTIQNYNSVQEMLAELNGPSNTEWLEKWKANSKASELESGTSTGKESRESRETFNNRFSEIGASPKNYISKNTLGIDSYLSSGNYNKSYTRLELMGYTLKQNSKGVGYIQDKVQLVDGYKYNKYGTLSYDENGAITNEWSEGLISTRIKEFITANGHYPNDREIITIYRNIVADMEDEEAWNKLQFIEDCKISAITKSPFVGGIEYYPTDKDGTFGRELLTNYINLGLWRRQEFNAQLTKDVLEISHKINEETESTTYNGKEYAVESIQDYMQDYNNAVKKGEINLAKQYADSQQGIYVNRLSPAYYYNKNYNREIKQPDYSNPDLGVEIKYRISISNISQSIETQITEVVDYYDDSLELTAVVLNAETNPVKLTKATISQYGAITQKTFNGFNKVYIKIGDRVQLATGAELTIDLTYKVKKMELAGFENYLNIGEKSNIAEINGYKTYYAANTSMPNRHGAIIGNTKTVAGLLDVNSTPGNLETIEEVTNGIVNYEDDSDKTTATLVVVDDEPGGSDNPGGSVNPGTIYGCVWDDSNNNGIREDDYEKRIAGVNVALCTRTAEGTATATEQTKQPEWIKGYNEKKYSKYIYSKVEEMQTNENGEYKFENIKPDTYYILFGYGNSYDTVLTNDQNNETYKKLNEGNTGKTIQGLNGISYNGQDYKSTKFQANLENGKYKVDEMEYDRKLDILLLSDAIDDWERVQAVNGYSETQNNHVAEVLASPTKVPTYLNNQYGKDEMEKLVKELIANTWKVAKTPAIEITADKNGATIPNVDLGLAERPITQLQITNNVKNVKVTLSDGSIVFDATQTVEANEIKNVIWKSNSLRTKGTTPTWGFIQLYLDEELMYGATIQIMYKMKIEPVKKGFEDYEDYDSLEYYAKGKAVGNKVETKVKQLVCYIPNKMQLNKEQSGSWDKVQIGEIIQSEASDNTNYVNRRLKAVITENFDTIAKISGTNINTDYLENNNLTTSQLITKESAQGGYECKVEIVEIENAVGRRMQTSIVGNFNPTGDPAEKDEDKGEQVAVLPPFGVKHVYFYVLAVVITGMLIAGIVFIKKKVIVK